MPLLHSKSPEAFSENIKREMAAGKPQKQALAIAYSVKRRANRANGGWIDNAVSDVLGDTYTNDKGSKKPKGYDTGGAVDPVNAVVSALQAGSGQAGGGTGSNPGMNTSSPTPASFAATAPSPASSPPQVASAPSPTPLANTTPTTAPLNAGIGSGGGLQNAGFGMAAPTAQAAPQVGQQIGGVTTTLQPGAMNRGGVPHLAFGGPGTGVGQMPWYVKNEARSLVHSGPIMSAVPGRTDRHNMNLASGSYVIPSAAVSHLGQSNTMAGMKILDNMFGAKPPTVGLGAPKPPRMMGIPGDRGGARGEGTGTPVPVVTAGGEYVVTPTAVARLGGGSLKHGHKILDAWVMKLHKDAARTIKKLPPPAKA